MGGVHGQQISQPFRRGDSRDGKIRGTRPESAAVGWVTPPQSTSRDQRLDGAGFREGHGDATGRGS